MTAHFPFPDVPGLSVRPAAADEYPALEALHLEAFGDPQVPVLVRALLAAPGRPPISLVAVEEGEGALVGHVMLSPGRLDAPERLVDVLTLSPLAVAAPFRRRGIAAMLVGRALAEAEREGCPLVFLEGSPAHYARLGFRPGSSMGLRRPSLRIPEPAFQVYPLSAYEPWMTGTFVYSETFWANDCVGLR